MNPQVEIFPLHFSRTKMLQALRDFLAAEFGLESVIREFSFSLNTAYDARRKQFNATRLWQQILKARGNSPRKLLVITEYDLFIPVLTFVLGEAQLGGRGGIVSVCRLQETFYQRPQNEDLLFQRLCKEAVHEIGHLYGLRHCYNPGCVMGPSTNVEGVDLKGWAFCYDCLNQFAEQRNKLARELLESG